MHFLFQDIIWTKNQFNQLKYQKEMRDPFGTVLSIIFFYSLKILSVTYRGRHSIFPQPT